MTSEPSTDLQRHEAVVVGDHVEVLVKSRERVKAYGEVFTPACMVNQMLDLVSNELETGPDFVDKTFLEPAAGDGNFLIAILRRKLVAIQTRFPAKRWPAESLFALASIYGIELLPDNHQAAKAAMLGEFVAFHQANGISCSPRTNLFRAASCLIDTNIIQGDTLASATADGQPITFSWWHRQPGPDDIVLRESFGLASLRQDGEGAFDFDIHPTYAPCPINRVHEGVRADA